MKPGTYGRLCGATYFLRFSGLMGLWFICHAMNTSGVLWSTIMRCILWRRLFLCLAIALPKQGVRPCSLLLSCHCYAKETPKQEPGFFDSILIDYLNATG